MAEAASPSSPSTSSRLRSNMSRALIIVLALVAAVQADGYAFNQVEEILSRVQVCLRYVPQLPSSYYVPAQECSAQARSSLDNGAAKEALAQSIASCLSKQRVSSAIVSIAQKCLSDSLAQDLQPALEPANYSDAQLLEINDRVSSCLTSIPVASSTACRYEALDKAYDGFPKESLAAIIAPCLQRKNIDAAAVAAGQSCIADALAQPLSA